MASAEPARPAARWFSNDMRIASAFWMPLLLTGCGIVGFGYQVADDTNPLRGPVRVRACEGGLIALSDGRVVRPQPPVSAFALRAALSESGWEVEIRPLGWEWPGVLSAEVWVKVRMWHCGTPWAQPIRIPVFPERIQTWMAIPLKDLR